MGRNLRNRVVVRVKCRLAVNPKLKQFFKHCANDHFESIALNAIRSYRK